MIHVPAVMAAEQARWPERAGRGYRAAGDRAKLAPLLRPEVAAVRTIERLQFRPGRYLQNDGGHGAGARRPHTRARSFRRAGSKSSRPRSTWLASPARRTAGSARSSRSSRNAASSSSSATPSSARASPTRSPALARSGTDAHLVVVGEGDSGTYRRKADALGVGGRVHFTGPVDSPEDYYAAADLLVHAHAQRPVGDPRHRGNGCGRARRDDGGRRLRIGRGARRRSGPAVRPVRRSAWPPRSASSWPTLIAAARWGSAGRPRQGASTSPPSSTPPSMSTSARSRRRGHDRADASPSSACRARSGTPGCRRTGSRS